MKGGGHNNWEINVSKNNKIANKNASEQNETCLTNKAGIQDNTYLKNQILTWLGEDPFQKFNMKQPCHTNCIGMEETSLSLVSTPTFPEISAISGSYPIRRSGSRLDDATEPSIIHYKKSKLPFSSGDKVTRIYLLRVCI